jgi:hypothetical protein
MAGREISKIREAFPDFDKFPPEQAEAIEAIAARLDKVNDAEAFSVSEVGKTIIENYVVQAKSLLEDIFKLANDGPTEQLLAKIYDLKSVIRFIATFDNLVNRKKVLEATIDETIQNIINRPKS